MQYFKKIDRSVSLTVLFSFILTVIASCVAPSGPLGAPNNLVNVPSVSSVQMTLAKTALAPGQTTQATVVAKSADGKVVAGTVDFSSQNPTIAAVSSNGVVTALTAGVAMIQATVASRFDTASVTVQPLASPVAVVAVALDSTSLVVGHAAQASAVAKDAAGNVITDQAVTWTSQSPTIASVSSLGAVMAVAPGAATIKGTISGTSGSASLTVVQVSPPPVATVAVAIDSTTLTVGHTAKATAVAKDAAGNVITGQTVTWASLSPTFATVSSTGTVTAVAAGLATIQGTVSGKAGSASLTVIQVAVGVRPDLAFWNFNDGTVGPYLNLWGTLVDFPDDPTGSGRGKVARFHYLRGSPTEGSTDRNVDIGYYHALHFGETMYFRGEFYLPVSDMTGGRKLIYWQVHDDWAKYGAGLPSMSLVLTFPSESRLQFLASYIDHLGVKHETSVYSAGTFPPNNWYTIEQQVTMESSIGAGDAIFRTWINGVLIFETTAWQWTDPAWVGLPRPGGNGTPLDIADYYLEGFLVGQQVNYNLAYDEYRYWDNVAFSTKRIGQ